MIDEEKVNKKTFLILLLFGNPAILRIDSL
jgi:hypothetical protein